MITEEKLKKFFLDNNATRVYIVPAGETHIDIGTASFKIRIQNRMHNIPTVVAVFENKEPDEDVWWSLYRERTISGDFNIYSQSGRIDSLSGDFRISTGDWCKPYNIVAFEKIEDLS